MAANSKRPNTKWSARASAWSPRGDLVILATRGKETTCIVLRDGKEIEQRTGAPRANRVAVLDSGAIVTTARDGTTHIAPSRGASHVTRTGFEVSEMVSVRGVAYAGGEDIVARYDEGTGAWVDMRCPRKGDVASIGEGAAGPVIAADDTILEWSGDAWVQRGRIRGDANAIVVAPDGTIYAVGSHVSTLTDRQGHELGNDAWGGAWIAGALHISTLGSVCRLTPDGVPTLVAAPNRTSEPHNHSLVSCGPRAVYTRATNVGVIDEHGYTHVWGDVPPRKPVAFKPPRHGRFKCTSKELTEFPRDLFAATDLQSIDLSHNHLTEVPAAIATLAQLRTLNLHLNCVSTLPPLPSSLEELDLGMNTSLRTLEVVGAKPMTEVPAAIRGLSRLRRLVLSMNELRELPDWFAELVALEDLDISSNRFTRVPEVLTALPKLRRLSIGYQPWTSGVTPLAGDQKRRLTGLTTLNKLTTLRELAIDRLDLPEAPKLDQLVALEQLDVEFNKFSASSKAALKKSLPRCEIKFG